MPWRSIKFGSLCVVPATVVVVLGLYLFGVIPYRVYVIHTGSMSPTIPSKSAVLVRKNRYHVGQVITFRVNGALVTHRLVSINADGTINTKGDADTTIDPWHVPKKNIVGGVVLAPHLVGYFLVYLRTSLGAASIVLGLLFVWETRWLAEGVEGQRRRRAGWVVVPGPGPK